MNDLRMDGLPCVEGLRGVVTGSARGIEALARDQRHLIEEAP